MRGNCGTPTRDPQITGVVRQAVLLNCYRKATYTSWRSDKRVSGTFTISRSTRQFLQYTAACMRADAPLLHLSSAHGAAPVPDMLAVIDQQARHLEALMRACCSSGGAHAEQPHAPGAASGRPAPARARGDCTALDAALARKARIRGLLSGGGGARGDDQQRQGQHPPPMPPPGRAGAPPGDAAGGSARRNTGGGGQQLPDGALLPIAEWRRRRHAAACVIQAAARGHLCRARLRERRAGDAAAAALWARRLARAMRAWRLWVRARRALRARVERWRAAHLPLLAAAAVLQRDGKWGLAAAHCDRSRAARALYSWALAACE
ncbi:MAG: hypothetical protein J3K34DRAFT_169747 [Monoraphidium minutum]|nr:MAG: hypothetical protein J3K34DRAFT_169747 [Monoraphidium minutum]